MKINNFNWKSIGLTLVAIYVITLVSNGAIYTLNETTLAGTFSEKLFFAMLAIPGFIFVWSLFSGAIVLPIILKEAKRLQTFEKTWSTPKWMANVVISVFAIIPGGMITDHIVNQYNFHPSPWYIIPSVGFGILFIYFAHVIARMVIPNKLTWAANKIFN